MTCFPRIGCAFGIFGTIILCIFLIVPHEAHAQESAFLFGYRYEEPIRQPLPYYAGSADSLSRPVYRTLLLTHKNGHVNLSEENPGLLVPRKDGFWRIDAKRSVYNNWVEDFIWSAPIGKKPELPGIQAYNGENCEGHRTQKINFAGPDYLALEVKTAGYCEDAAHPWNFNTLAVIPIDSMSHLGIPISQILGPAGHNSLHAAAERFLGSVRPAERELYLPAPDEASWNVARDGGRWTVVGRLDPGSVNFGSPADFEVDISIPQSVTGRLDSLAPTWDEIRAFAPDAVDAFSAPSGDMLIIVRPRVLSVHPLAEGTIGPATRTTRLPRGATTVLAQWAVGPRVSRWAEPFFENTDDGPVTQSR